MLEQSTPGAIAGRLLRIGLLAGTSALLVACGGGDDTTDSDIANGDGGTSTDAGAGDSTAAPGAFRATPIGEVLVFGAANRTLYTFANDTDGVSTCTGGCAANWPPVEAAAAVTSGDFSTLTRDDATLQWSFKGSPLYYYQGDAAEGEINGQGIGGVWFVARPDPIGTADTGIGTVLSARGSVGDGSADAAQRTDVDGRTLYVFANDTPGTSNCNGGCAANWPPLYADTAAKGSGDYSVIARTDGSTQWAYRSSPLYLFGGDSAAGDTNGEGVGGVWSAARP